MAQTNIDTKPALLVAYLVTFTWGTSHVTRYCKYDSDITVGGETFTADPKMTIDMTGSQNGGVNDVPWKVQGNIRNSPFSSLCYPWPHAKVKVKIEEIIPGDDTSRKIIYYGKVKKAKAKSNGLAQLEVSGIKAALEIVVGRSVLTTCDYPALGLGRCGYDIEANTLTGIITDVGTGNNPNALTTDAFDPDSWNNNKWNRGYVEYDGLRIGIRQANGAGVLSLRDAVPPSWAGASAKIVPGCRKDIENCRYHNMEDVFAGFGYKTPPYNPQFQDAPG